MGGTQNSFTVTGLPSWLSADQSTGSIPAGGLADINFTVSDQLEQGVYSDTLALEVSGQGDDPFFINITVTICR